MDLFLAVESGNAVEAGWLLNTGCNPNDTSQLMRASPLTTAVWLEYWHFPYATPSGIAIAEVLRAGGAEFSSLHAAAALNQVRSLLRE